MPRGCSRAIRDSRCRQCSRWRWDRRQRASLQRGQCFGAAATEEKVLASIVYQASPHDPLMLGAVLGAILLLGLLSCWAPARRALRIEPLAALRQE